MRIEVRDYFSIRECVLEADGNLAIIAGRNGCGKSQLLAAVAARYGGYGGDGLPGLPEDAEATVDPAPAEVVYHPPERLMWSEWVPAANWVFSHWTDQQVEPSRPSLVVFDYGGGTVDGGLRSDLPLASQMHAVSGLTPTLADRGRRRFTWDAANAYAWLSDADTVAKWEAFRGAMVTVTGKVLSNDAHTQTWWWVGAGDPEGRSMDFDFLSSGEKEAAIMLWETVFSPPGALFIIDEFEANLHPSLQVQLLDKVLCLLPDRSFVLLTTHSPALVAYRDAECTWWMDPADDAASGRNQLQRIGGNLPLVRSVFSLYEGCALAERIPEIEKLAADQELEEFLDECYAPSEAVSEAKDGDPQIQSIGTAVTLGLARHERFRHLDFGCGHGRALAAFAELEERDRKRLELHLVDSDPDAKGKLTEKLPDPHGFGGVTILQSLDGIEGIHYAVAANVLHEIAGHQFAECFSELWNTLATGGELHLIEALRLPKGESGFVSFGLQGYEIFFETLGIRHVTRPHRSRGGLPLVEVVAVRSEGRALQSDDVRDAFVAALIATRDWCLAELEGDPTGRERAFHMQNVVNVVRTLRDLQGG